MKLLFSAFYNDNKIFMYVIVCDFFHVFIVLWLFAAELTYLNIDSVSLRRELDAIELPFSDIVNECKLIELMYTWSKKKDL